MWEKYAAISSILLFTFALDKSEAQDAASSSAAEIAAAGYLDHEPVHPNPLVDELAGLISDGLLNSKVFGDFANFQVYQPYDLFFTVGTNLLTRAGIYDPSLAKIAADAGVEVGLVSSKLYFDTIGYMLAKFLFTKGLVTVDDVEYFSLRIVTAIEVVACLDGLIDTQSVMDAVVYGFFSVLEFYGLTDYDSMAELFYLFAEEIEELAAGRGLT